METRWQKRSQVPDDPATCSSAVKGSAQRFLEARRGDQPECWKQDIFDLVRRGLLTFGKVTSSVVRQNQIVDFQWVLLVTFLFDF